MKEWMSRLTCLVVSTLAAGMVSAQTVPGFLEGPISEVKPGAGTVRVNGVLVTVPPGTPMASPTVDLIALAAQLGENRPLRLLKGDKLAGRSQNGFLQGTCLCETVVDLATGEQTMVDMVLEPAENVVVGSVTAHNCVTATCDPDDDPVNELRISGLLLDFNSDQRIQSEPPSNRGFQLDLSAGGSLVGQPAEGEGYFGKAINGEPERQLHYYVVAVEGGVLLNAGMPEVSVSRAQCRDRGDEIEWEVQGSTHDPNAGVASIFRASDGVFVGSAAVSPEADDPAFGEFEFDVRGAFAACDGEIEVTFNGASTIAGVDVRIDEED